MAGELRATVGSDVVWHSEAGDPVTNEGLYTGLGGGVRKWDGFGPPSEAVNDREKASRGPTRSTWRLPKRRSGGGRSVRGA